MLKTAAGLWPLALGVAGVGVVIGFLLGREMALGRWLLGAFLVAHGVVHVAFVVPPPATKAAGAATAAWPFELSRSWLVTSARWEPGAVRAIGTSLVCAVVLGFLLAGLATVGILVPAGWWRALVVVSAFTSAVLLAAFPSPQLVLGLAIDAVLLWIAVAATWAPSAVP